MSSLSVVDEESLAEVADSVAVEGTTGRTLGDVADVVQVVGAAAAVAFGIAACPKHQRLCDVVVLIAI